MLKKLKFLLGIAIIPTVLCAMLPEDKSGKGPTPHKAYYFLNKSGDIHCDPVTAEILQRKRYIEPLDCCYHIHYDFPYNSYHAASDPSKRVFIHTDSNLWGGLSLHVVGATDANPYLDRKAVPYFMNEKGILFGHSGNLPLLEKLGLIGENGFQGSPSYHALENSPIKDVYWFLETYPIKDFSLKSVEYQDD